MRSGWEKGRETRMKRKNEAAQSLVFFLNGTEIKESAGNSEKSNLLPAGFPFLYAEKTYNRTE